MYPTSPILFSQDDETWSQQMRQVDALHEANESKKQHSPSIYSQENLFLDQVVDALREGHFNVDCPLLEESFSPVPTVEQARVQVEAQLQQVDSHEQNDLVVVTYMDFLQLCSHFDACEADRKAQTVERHRLLRKQLRRRRRANQAKWRQSCKFSISEIMRKKKETRKRAELTLNIVLD